MNTHIFNLSSPAVYLFIYLNIVGFTFLSRNTVPLVGAAIARLPAYHFARYVYKLENILQPKVLMHTHRSCSSSCHLAAQHDYRLAKHLEVDNVSAFLTPCVERFMLIVRRHTPQVADNGNCQWSRRIRRSTTVSLGHSE
jgi:hypothetical protein